MDQSTNAEREADFAASDRPDAALITNHGYAGASIPIGGAPDTGGQNLYVNTLALKLDQLGYRVTIFTRGGFPFFESARMRSEIEYLSDHVRYVFVPGGGDTFIPKEDIARALDEELEWLDGFIAEEAEARGCHAWEVYEFINSHYWDAAVLATRLIERWRDEIVCTSLHRLLEGIVPEQELAATDSMKHYRAMGEVPGFHLGRILIDHVGDRAQAIHHQVRAAASTWAAGHAMPPHTENQIVDEVLERVRPFEDALDHTLQRFVASAALGQEILSRAAPQADESLKRKLDVVDRHVWTPHSLGDLKDYNYRNRTIELRRSLKFCERRSHERMVSARTHAFAATSSEIAERLWTHYRVPIEDTFYFPPCVDTDVFRPYADDETASTYEYLSDRSGIDVATLRDAVIIFETSRMDRTKRKDLLLAAFARLAPEFPDVYLFIGGGPPNEIFETLADQVRDNAALPGRAFLLKAIPDEHIGAMFSIADIYASTSEMEGFGMSVSQAAAAGTAIASADTIPFSIHHAGDEVELFAVGDVGGFVDALRRLLTSESLRRERAPRLIEKTRALDWVSKTAEFLDYLRRRGFEVAPGVVRAPVEQP